MRRQTSHKASFALLVVSLALLAPGVVQAAVQVATLSVADLEVPTPRTSPLRFSSLATEIGSDATKVVGSRPTTRTATSQQGRLAPDATGRYEAVDVGSTGGKGAALTDNSQTIMPVPEPSTWMLLIAGVGLVGWTARQRLRASSLVRNH